VTVENTASPLTEYSAFGQATINVISGGGNTEDGSSGAARLN